MADPLPARVIATAHGAFRVEGLDRFAIGGDLEREVAAAVAAHHARFGVAPEAVIWDDIVLDFRPGGLFFGLTRVFVPADDPYVAAALDSAGRVALRVEPAPRDGGGTGDPLATLTSSDAVAHAPALARLIGWPGAAPLTQAPMPRPARAASSIAVVIDCGDTARDTMACLLAIRRQRIQATLAIILVHGQSHARERMAVEATCNALFGRNARVTVRHLASETPFDHGARFNAAAVADGEVMVAMSNACVLVDPDTLQTIADWALEPGVGAASPRLIGADGLVGGGGGGAMIGPVGADAPTADAVPYLSEVVRLTDGGGVVCAAIARSTWERLGGTDAGDLSVEGEDADLARRLTRAGYVNLFVGTHRARHASEARERPEHDHAAEQRRPFASSVQVVPSFKDRNARALCDYVELYHRASELRLSAATPPAPLAAAFAALEAAAATAGGVGGTDDYFARVDAALRGVCAAFFAVASPEQVPGRLRDSFARLPDAMRSLAARIVDPGQADDLPREEPEDHATAEVTVDAAAAPTAALPDPAPIEPPAIVADPDPERAFVSHGDAGAATAPHRVLVFADSLGASPQILFLEGLAAARADGRAAVRIVTEEDLLTLRSLRGAEHVSDWLRATVAHMRPTAIVFSRFAALDGYRAIQAATADLTDVPRLCHIDDDFFTLPAVIGIDRYREARHPRRIHCLTLIATEADLILASTIPLAERLAASFGAAKIGLCAMSEGGAPMPAPRAEGPAAIGYFGSATHNRDLELIAPALRQVKADRPDVRIDIVGSVAKLSAAAALGDLVTRSHGLEPDYPSFRAAMRGWGWRIGLAPLLAHPFNAAKTPIKWTEYAQAGIPVIASRTEPYLALGRRGALLLASPDEWYGRIVGLLDSEARRRALVAAADRLLDSFDGWRRTEDRLLGLLERAAARRTLAPRAA